jgi:hypothetical protein
MGYPVCSERESYKCPYCGYVDYRSIRGTFSTEKIEEEKPGGE